VGTGAIEVVSESLGVNQVSLCQNVLVISWTGKPTAEAARALGPVTDEILGRLGVDKPLFIHLIPNNMPLPDSNPTATPNNPHSAATRKAQFG
jgi:hypothetical protein